MDDLAPGAYVYRPLRGLPDPQTGWDVYALQSGFRGFGFREIDLDGVLGDVTAEVIWRFQRSHNLIEDGIAGIATQTTIGIQLARRFRKEYGLPRGLPRGHIEKECGFQIGNYTAPYSNGSRDLGIVQRNTRYAEIEEAFDVMDSLVKLCRQLEDRQVRYQSEGLDNRTAWRLAAGSWNAPAFTNWMAGIRDSSALEPKGENLTKINAYMDAVMAYTTFRRE